MVYIKEQDPKRIRELAFEAVLNRNRQVFQDSTKKNLWHYLGLDKMDGDI